MTPSPLEHLSLPRNGLTFTALASGPLDGERVILLHGFPQFADAWTALLQTLGAAGYRAIAIDQRGYSTNARPSAIDAYSIDHLTSDVILLADALDAPTFHLIGHDWGGFLAWKLAADLPARLRSLTVLSTAHIDAFLNAVASDPDQRARSQYLDFFKMPSPAPEDFFLNNDAARLRAVYQGKVSAPQVASNLQRLSAPGALTAALNWYRALDRSTRIGPIHVPTLYLWGDQDMALGKVAAEATARFVDADYNFIVLNGYSHSLLEEAPTEVRDLILQHLAKQHQQ